MASACPNLEPIRGEDTEEALEPTPLPPLFANPNAGTVAESFLPSRSPAGSQFPGSVVESNDPNNPGVVAVGTLDFDPDGFLFQVTPQGGAPVSPLTTQTTITVNYAGTAFDIDVTGEAGDFLFVTPLGNVLLIDGQTGEYKYYLTDDISHPNAGLVGPDDTVMESFEYLIIGSNERTATSTLTLEIQTTARPPTTRPSSRCSRIRPRPPPMT